MNDTEFKAVITSKYPLTLKPHDRWNSLVQNNLNAYDAGKPVRVKIVDWSDEISSQMFDYFHVLRDAYLCSGLSPCSSKSELKEHLKIEHGVSRIKLICGEKYIFVKSTTDYTSKEGVKLIDGTLDEMAQAGVDLTPFMPEWQELREEIKCQERKGKDLK